MRRVLIFCVLAVVCAVPALGAEIAVPGLDRVWEEAEGCGVRRDTTLDQGLSNLFADALDQAGASVNPLWFKPDSGLLHRLRIWRGQRRYVKWYASCMEKVR